MARKFILLIGLSLAACGAIRLSIPVDRSMLHRVTNAEGEMGYIDSRGQVAIPFTSWDHATDFRGDFAIVGKGENYHGIDRSGATVPAFEEKGWQLFSHIWSNGQILVRDKAGTNKVGVVDTEGNVVVPFEWDSIEALDAFGMAVVTRDGKKGLIRSDGSVVIPPEWDMIQPIGDGTFLEGYRGNDYFALNRGPEVTDPADTTSIVPLKKNGLHGAQLWNGEVLIPPTWRDLVLVHHDGNTYARVRDKRHYGLIDMEGKTVIPRTWQYFGRFGTNSQGVDIAKRGDKWGMINLAGEEVVPFEWDALEEADENGYVFARKGEHWGAINNESKILIPFEWDHIMSFNSQGTATARKEGKYFLINRKGEQITAFPWSVGSFDHRGWADARDGVKNGMIRADGSIVIPMIWEVSQFGKRGAIKEMARYAEYRNYPIFEMLNRDPPFFSKVKRKWDSWFGNPMQGAGFPFQHDFHYELRDQSGRLIWDSDSFSYRAKSWWVFSVGAGIFLIGFRMPNWVVERNRRNLSELKAFNASDNKYPPVAREDVQDLKVPVLFLGGSKTEAVAKFTDDELDRLLPKESHRRVTLDGASHILWIEEPVQSRNAVLRFLRGVGKGD